MTLEVCFICRYGMFAPGAVALAVSVLVLLFFKDSPEAAGFAPIEASTQKKPVKETSGRLGVVSDPSVQSCIGNHHRSAFPELTVPRGG